MKHNNDITILTQAFYGNRTITTVTEDTFDYLMLGYLDKKYLDTERMKLDRTMIRVPGTENLVLFYNKYQEEERLENLREFIQDLRGNTYRMNPTAVIPELGIVLYSRCFACRVNEAGDPISLEDGDVEKVLPYLAS